jgi:hypothetical protein
MWRESTMGEKIDILDVSARDGLHSSRSISAMLCSVSMRPKYS